VARHPFYAVLHSRATRVYTRYQSLHRSYMFQTCIFSLFLCLPKKPDSYTLVRIKCSVTLKPLSVFNKAARTARLKTGENRETLNIVMLIKTRRANSNAIMFTTRVDMSWVKNESGQKVTTEKIAAQKRITALLLAFWRVQT